MNVSRGNQRSSRRFEAERSMPPLFEACERRLVLSAQLLFDVLGDQALEMHGNMLPGQSIPLEQHLNEAHEATGLDQVREQYGLTGAGQTVAVIDSGIAWDHVALGQGYGPGYRVVGGWDFTEENDNQPYDDGPTGFHGTHVSGIIGSDAAGQQGVAPDVDLVALRVFNDAGQGQLAWVERALQWVHDHQHSFENPITTVNLSIGTTWNGEAPPSWATLEDELQALYEDGVSVVASAGNSFQDYQSTGLSYPAASQFVLPVASVDDDGQLSDFSQRSQRALAAPGSNIISTVPDHVFGRDGNVNDFGAASGTSMAAPYVSGAAVLVRQAMEMTGWESINASTIAEHLRSTADTVFDAATGLHYDSLNVQQAIDSLLPQDTVGDFSGQASSLDITQSSFNTWINHLQDTDVYRFVAGASGTLTLDADSDWLSDLNWSLNTAGQQVGAGQLDATSVDLQAGQTYELIVSANQEIGPLEFQLDFAAHGDGESSGSSPPSTDLGTIHYWEDQVTADTGYAVTATRDGIFTVQWASASPVGTLAVSTEAGQEFSNAIWNQGVVRLDIPVQAGQQLDIDLPGTGSQSGQLALANVLEHTGTSVAFTAGPDADQLSLDLSQGVRLGLGSVEYSFASSQVEQLRIDGASNNDTLEVTGSAQIDKVDLRPGGSTIGTDHTDIVIAGVEQISYHSGGGADRVYLYDSDTDDTLTARPGTAELVGVGYRFEVTDVSRIFIHATGGGEDNAFLYDSPDDDRLSVRPQFTSLSGEGYFNYVRGFERVYAYASAGGHDVANLYDSAEADRFSTSGVSASIVGPGFSSFTRSFEEVTAHSTGGGSDRATLYGADDSTRWQQGSDFIGFKEGTWQREARGFSQVETYVASQPFSMSEPIGAAIDMPVAASMPVAETAGADSVPGMESLARMTGVSTPAISSHMWALAEPTIPFPALPTGEYPSVDADQVQAAGWDGGIESSLEAADLLRETRSLRDMLASQLHLPEEELLNRPELERDVLDEAFRQYDQNFID